MKIIMLFVAAMSLSLVSMVGPAIADENTDDARCYIVSWRMSASSDPATKTAGIMAAMYWVGRMDGRGLKLDAIQKIALEQKDMPAPDVSKEAQRCGAYMVMRGKALIDMEQVLGASK